MTDSAEWQKLHIASTAGTVCSYKFQHKDSMDNVYQVMIKDYSNMDIGIYFYSQQWDGIVDYKIFDGADCAKMKYCEVISDTKGVDGVVFSMDESEYMTLNLIPKTSSKMNAVLEYRLVNKLQ